MSLSIGKRLKSAREAKGVDLEQVSRITKVQLHILEAVEEDQVEALLEPAYAKIFIKNYAEYLGLDGSALVREYLSQRGSIPEPGLALETEVTRAQAQVPAVQKVLAPASVGLAALIGIVFLGYLAMDLYGTLSQQSQATTKVALSFPGEVQPAPKLLVARNKPLKLTIAAQDSVWLQVKADGAVIFQNTLSKGDRESWTAKKELELWTGNAAATQLSLNGKKLRPLGRGVKKGVKITHAGLDALQ